MDEVAPWIKEFFLNLATTLGSNYNTLPPIERSRKCQLKKVLTSEPKDYYWVLLSDKEHEVPARIPREVAEQCVRKTKRGERLTEHSGSLIEIRDFSPLLIRVEDGPSTSAPRKVLALDVGKAKLRGASREPTWGSPQPLESVQDLKEWVDELRKPGGNQDILKVRKKQQDEAKAAKQSIELPLPDLAPRLKPTIHPTAAQRKVASTTPATERLPMQRYRRKWKKAVPGLDEFAHRLQLPEGVWLKISEKLADREAKTKPRSSGMHPTNKPSSMRGALEIGSSPARLSSAPPLERWSASPGMLGRLYNDRETEMSSDVESLRLSSPVDVYHDAEMNEIEPQLEPDTVPETPQAPPDSQTQNLSPPPPAQPPRPRSPLPSSSSNPQQNYVTSPSSIHTSIQAVSGSQLPSLDKPPVWVGSGNISSGGPDFLLPSPRRDDSHAAVSKLPLESHPPPGKLATEEPARPTASELPGENEAVVKETLRGPAFEETIGAAIERAFQESAPEEVVAIADGSPAISPATKVTVAEPPPPKPRSKSPLEVMQMSLPGPPSPLDRFTTTGHLQPPVRQPFQALNRRVPIPEVGPTRELVRGENKNGVLVPASDEIKLSLSSNQNPSSQPAQSSQSISSSHPLPRPGPLPPSQPIPSSEPQAHRSASQPDKSIAQEGDSIIVQINETVADIEAIQDLSGNTQSSLEYASTQGEGNAATAAEPQKPTDMLAGAIVEVGKVATSPLQSPLPQIVAIREVESQQNVPEEIDELEGDSELDNRSPVAKRKSKPVRPKSSVKGLKPPRSSKPIKPSKSPSKPASLVGFAAEKGPPKSSSKLPPKPVVLVERKRAPVVPTDDKASASQKRRHASPSEEGFPVPQPIKRSRIHGHRRPAQKTLPPIQRTPSPAPLERQNSGVSGIPRSAKGKGRAEGIKGLENIGTSKDAAKEPETIRVKPKKAPDTGSKRKPSDAFSSLDDSRDIKRQRVALEPEPRKLTKQLSFVDPDKLKRPFRSKPQIPKTSAQQDTTSIITVGPSAMDEPDGDVRTSKYFNPRLYREPEYPPVTAITEVQQPGKVITSNESAHGDRHHSENIRPRVDSRKTGTSNADRQLPGKSRKTFRTLDDESPARSTTHTRIQPSKHADDMEGDSGPTKSRYPPARKLGSFAPDLNPPPLPGLPGGRLMNKQLREILIRTGKVRTREAKAAESGLNGR